MNTNGQIRFLENQIIEMRKKIRELESQRKVEVHHHYHECDDDDRKDKPTGFGFLDMGGP